MTSKLRFAILALIGLACWPVAAQAARFQNLQIKTEIIIPRLHETIVVESSFLDPGIDRRNDAIYRDTLFSRDDQIFHTLDAGINVGQHEGGGKSLEIRRFGFNLDHGGVSGGLKVLVDGVQQNQATQGHGQGYLGQLKNLTPELVQEVNILNGPFSAEYGDFSGLGVVHIKLKESLPEQFTARFQGGSFNTFRNFLAYSPKLKEADAFIAYEGFQTDGPFVNPLQYRRDNLTGNFTRRLTGRQSLGFKFNVGRNRFFSPGQIPLDAVEAGTLDRFGAVDPDSGGRTQSGAIGIYYRKEGNSGDVFKIDGFLSRSLFDLYSNFTFYLNDEVNGDEFQQHDSRFQEGVNVQYLRPHKLFGKPALFTVGSNLHDNHIKVGLFSSVDRDPKNTRSLAHVQVGNAAGYVQQGIEILPGRLHVESGLRYDYFGFNVEDKIDSSLSGKQGAARLQPKFNLAYRPSLRVPLKLHFNYGRGISSQDARGVIQKPSGVKVSTTDFYQFGISQVARRISLSADFFLIDRSNEQVYVPDDGSFEFRGPSRAYGFEAKTSFQWNRYLAIDVGITRVGNAYYQDTFPRVYVDRAPHVVANAAFTLSGWRGVSGSLRLRHIGNYRLDGQDPGIRAAGHTVLDLGLLKRLSPLVDLNLSIDNLTNKSYYETQNYFESRLRPGDPVRARIHGTPGYPIGVTLGLTFHVSKN